MRTQNQRTSSLPFAMAMLLAIFSLDRAAAYERVFEWGGGNGFLGSNQRVGISGISNPFLGTTNYNVRSSATSSTNLCYRTFNFFESVISNVYLPGNGQEQTSVSSSMLTNVLGQTIMSSRENFTGTRFRIIPVVAHGITLVDAGVGIGPFGFRLNAGGHVTSAFIQDSLFTPIGPGVRPTVRMMVNGEARVTGWVRGSIDAFIGAGGINVQTQLAFLAPRVIDRFYTTGSEIRNAYNPDLLYSLGSLNIWAWGRIGLRGLSYNWSQNVVNFNGFGGTITFLSGDENIFTLSAPVPSRSTFRKGSSRPAFLTPNYPSILR